MPLPEGDLGDLVRGKICASYAEHSERSGRGWWLVVGGWWLVVGGGGWWRWLVVFPLKMKASQKLTFEMFTPE